MTNKKQPDTRPKVTVRATALGFFGGARRRKGDVFQVPEGVTGKWFVPTDPTLAEKDAVAREQAAHAKRQAEESARQKKADADKAARDAKAQADKDLKNEKAEIDATHKREVFGNLMGNREVKPQVEIPETAPEGGNAPAGEPGDGQTSGAGDNVEDVA